jgi:hypothetical protein
MTPKETDKYKKYIADVKRSLSAEKRKYGGYHDGRGMRYYPPKAYLKLQDFKGGLSYLKWFQKNFPDDSGFPDFLMEWTIILFMTGKLKDAEKKAFQTFCSNTYLFDKYFDRPIIRIDKYEFSNIDIAEYTKTFEYSSKQSELVDFSNWLTKYLLSENFIKLSSKFIDISKRIKKETDNESRGYLLRQLWQLEEEA